MTRREAEDMPASSVLAYSARARERAAAKKARLTGGGVTLRCMPTTAFTATDRCLAVFFFPLLVTLFFSFCWSRFAACLLLCLHSYRQVLGCMRSAYVSIRQHTSAYVSMRMPTTAFTATDSIRQHTSAYVSIRQHTYAYYCVHSYRQHTSAYVSIRQHMSAYVSIRQHAYAHYCVHGYRQVLCCMRSAYVSMRMPTTAFSIRQHMSAYVSIRQHAYAY
jgi:hypothetical protein